MICPHPIQEVMIALGINHTLVHVDRMMIATFQQTLNVAHAVEDSHKEPLGEAHALMIAQPAIVEEIAAHGMIITQTLVEITMIVTFQQMLNAAPVVEVLLQLLVAKDLVVDALVTCQPGMAVVMIVLGMIHTQTLVDHTIPLIFQLMINAALVEVLPHLVLA